MRKARAEEKEGPAALARRAPGTSTYVTGWNLPHDPAKELSSPPEHRRGDRPPQADTATRLDDSNTERYQRRPSRACHYTTG